MADIFTKAERSRIMSLIKGKDTKPEKAVERVIRRIGYRFRRQAKDLPGTPDFVLTTSGLAIFVDGDFWHGWRFPLWRHKMKKYWRNKIDRNRARDQRNFKKLRRLGVAFIRIWEHELKSPEKVYEKIYMNNWDDTDLIVPGVSRP